MRAPEAGPSDGSEHPCREIRECAPARVFEKQVQSTTSSAGKTGTIVVSALRARANFGKLLRRVDDESGSLVIEERGVPRAVLLSIRDYVKLAAPEPRS